MADDTPPMTDQQIEDFVSFVKNCEVYAKALGNISVTDAARILLKVGQVSKRLQQNIDLQFRDLPTPGKTQ